MTEPREKLSSTQVRDASLADWRQILGRIKARFRTGDFRTGLALVNKIGAAAEAANHHPDIQLTYSDVIVTLASHDVRGITTATSTSHARSAATQQSSASTPTPAA